MTVGVTATLTESVFTGIVRLLDLLREPRENTEVSELAFTR